MTRPITDSELYAAIDGAFDLWQSRYEGDLPAHTFSAGFEEKIAAIPDRHPAARRRKPVRTAAAAAIIAAALTMTIGADVVPAAKTFRSGMVEVVSQLLPKSTDQTYTVDTDHEGETRRPVLGWLPEGMVEVDRTELTNITLLTFENTNGDRFSIYTKRITEGETPTSSFDTEDAEIEEIFLHENPASLITEDHDILIIFFINNYRCSLSGTLTADEAVKIAENIILK